MKRKKVDYEEKFMGMRKKEGDSYQLERNEDYRMDSLIKSMQLTKEKLLDVGSGGGVFTESLPYYFPKLSLYGCDVSKTAISYAKKLGSGKVKYAVIKNKKLPYKSNFFDVCICLDVLEHVPEINSLLKEVRRVLKKNGKFFVIVPCEGQPLTHTWVFQKLGIGKDLTYRYFGHIHPEYSHKYVTNLLEKHGFIIEKKAYSEHFFYQFVHLFMLFLPKRILEMFIGEQKTSEYTHSSLISSPKSSKDPIGFGRRLWLAGYDFLLKYPLFWETILFRRIPVTAWKFHVVAIKK